MTFNTKDSSKWLEYDENQKFHADLDKSHRLKEIAPTIYYDKIMACLKALKVKKITDLQYSDRLQHDHILSILHANVKSEHDLICSHYDWHGDDEISTENHRRLNLAGDYSYELDQINELKKLPRKTIIYRVDDSNQKINYRQFFYVKDGKPHRLFLRSFGFKYGIIKDDPYQDLTIRLGEQLFGDRDYFVRNDL